MFKHRIVDLTYFGVLNPLPTWVFSLLCVTLWYWWTHCYPPHVETLWTMSLRDLDCVMVSSADSPQGSMWPSDIPKKTQEPGVTWLALELTKSLDHILWNWPGPEIMCSHYVCWSKSQNNPNSVWSSGIKLPVKLWCQLRVCGSPTLHWIRLPSDWEQDDPMKKRIPMSVWPSNDKNRPIINIYLALKKKCHK